MEKIATGCVCEGTGYIAVVDSGGDGVDYVECPNCNLSCSPHESEDVEAANENG
jgi:hypothetical protein